MKERSCCDGSWMISRRGVSRRSFSSGNVQNALAYCALSPLRRPAWPTQDSTPTPMPKRRTSRHEQFDFAGRSRFSVLSESKSEATDLVSAMCRSRRWCVLGQTDEGYPMKSGSPSFRCSVAGSLCRDTRSGSAKATRARSLLSALPFSLDLLTINLPFPVRSIAPTQ